MPNFGSDSWIDAQLRNVPVPPDLLSRLAGTGAASEPNGADARLDAVLRNVSVPPYLEARLLRIARQRPRPLWRRFGLAASISLMLGLSTAGYVGLITGVLVPGEPMFATTRSHSRRATEPNRGLSSVGPTQTNNTPPHANSVPPRAVGIRRVPGSRCTASVDDSREPPVATEEPTRVALPLADSVATFGTMLNRSS